MKWSGILGIGREVETAPDVFDYVITEHEALGDVKQRTEVLDSSGTILPKYRTTTSISVLSRGVNGVEYGDIVYITFKGKKWAPGSITEEPPRITIFIGEVYNGPTP